MSGIWARVLFSDHSLSCTLLLCVPSLLHFAIKKTFTKLHTNPHPIIQPCTKAEGLTGSTCSVYVSTSYSGLLQVGNPICLTSWGSLELERKDGNRPVAPGSPAVCSSVWPRAGWDLTSRERAQSSLTVTARGKCEGSGAGWGPGVRSQG